MTIDLDELDPLVYSIFNEHGLMIPPGESLRFTATGNPTTGFDWYLREDLLGDNIVVASDYYEDAREDGMEDWTGIGGTYYWTLSAAEGANTGDQGTFRIEYYRDWEPDLVDIAYEFPIHIA